MMDTINRLRSIATMCQKGIPLPPTLAAWLGLSLTAFLEHRCSSVDQALGLRFAPGGVPWWLEEGMRCRDAALREIARRYVPNEVISAQAAHIARLSRRFEVSCWRVDKLQSAMPAHYVGTPKELLWVAFKSGARMPLGDRRLRSILVGCNKTPSPHNDNSPDSGNPAAAVRHSAAGTVEPEQSRPTASIRPTLAQEAE